MWQLDGGAAGGVKQQQFGSALVGCNWCPLVQKPCSNGRQHDSVHILTAIHNVCLSFSFSVYVCVCVSAGLRGHTNGTALYTTGDKVQWFSINRQPEGKCYDELCFM